MREKLFGTAADRVNTLRAQLVFYVRRGERFHELSLHSCDGFLRRAGRREHGERGHGVEARESGFRDGREIGHERRALGRARRDQAQPPCLRLWQRRDDVDKRQCGFPADQRLRGRTAAFIGHVRHADAGHVHQKLGRHVTGGAYTCRRKGNLSGLRLGERNKILHGFRRQRWMHRQDLWADRNQGDGRERLLVIVLQGLVEVRGDRKGAVGPEQQCVAVRYRFCGQRSAESARRAAAVIDDPLLASVFVQLLGKDAADRVGGTARGPRDEQPDRLARILLRLRGNRYSEQHGRHDELGSQRGSHSQAPPDSNVNGQREMRVTQENICSERGSGSLMT